MFHSRLVSQDDSMVLHLEGYVDGTTFPIFEAALREAVSGEARQIQVDCQRLTYIQEAGLDALSKSQRELENRGGALWVHISHQECSNWKLCGFFQDYFPELLSPEDRLSRKGA